MARRATYVKQQRESARHVLLLDAGDSLVFDEDPAVRTQGASSIEIMNMVGYQAVAIGEGDLVLGKETLQTRMSEAAFPFLSANLLLKDGRLFAEPYTVLEMGGHRIGIIGLTGGTSSDEFTVADPLSTTAQYVEKVKKEAGIIILLSHLGLVENQKIADAIPGIDVIVSGGGTHSAQLVESDITKSLVAHADIATRGHAGRRIGSGTFHFDELGELTDHEWQSISLLPEIEDDPEMVEWLKTQQ